MPKRTNDFQDLLELICRALNHASVKITSPAMVTDNCGHGEREIDILMEATYGPYRIRVAVEAKHEKEPMTIDNYDSYVHRHSGTCKIPVDKLILVTQAGFSTYVKKKALSEGVHPLTLEEAKAKDWRK